MGYTKLDENLVTSSIWSEDDKTLRVWVYLMSQAGPNGAVLATIPAIARACGYNVPTLEAILKKLSGPDKYSRTPDLEGRRIVVLHEPEFAIYLVNHKKYRGKDHTNAVRQRRWRNAHRNGTITAPNAVSQPITQAEAEAKAERKTEAAAPPALDGDAWARRAADAYLEHHPKAKVPGAMFRALKPLVLKHGWLNVEPELRAYLRQTPIGRFSWDTQFAGCFGSWAKSDGPRGPGGARLPVTAANDAVIDAFVRKVEGVQG